MQNGPGRLDNVTGKDIRGHRLTYECSSFGLEKGAPFADWIDDSSSRWTATENRFQKAGSRTAAITTKLLEAATDE